MVKIGETDNENRTSKAGKQYDKKTINNNKKKKNAPQERQEKQMLRARRKKNGIRKGESKNTE